MIFSGLMNESGYKKVVKETVIPKLDIVMEALKFDSKTSYEGKLYSAAQYYSNSFQTYL